MRQNSDRRFAGSYEFIELPQRFGRISVERRVDQIPYFFLAPRADMFLYETDVDGLRRGNKERKFTQFLIESAEICSNKIDELFCRVVCYLYFANLWMPSELLCIVV